jgi:hypothetical protein
MFTVFYVNFWYGPDVEFKTVEEAIEFAKSKGFETAIRRNRSDAVGYWSPIGGYRKF